MKMIGRLVILFVVAITGCQRQGNGDLRESYERMMAQAERRAAEEAARTPPPPEQPGPDLSLESPAAPPAEPDPGPAEPELVPDTATAEIEEPALATTAAIVMRDARVGEHDGFDRIVFEFDGPELPAHQLGYVDAPVRECGTGGVVPIAGNAFLRVRFDPARAYEMIGSSPRPTVEQRDRTMDFGALRQFTLTCDSDGRVEWVMGLTGQHRYRVLELSVPMRLVVDVFLD